MIKYAGIGSRETPENITFIMYGIAQTLVQRGFYLRSGHADGADKAFEYGAASIDPKMGEIWTANHVTENSPWLTHAAQFHPAWDKCGPYAKKLHARNSAIMLGAFLNDPVVFVVCWTKDGKASGGTGQALRIAKQLYIPVFNLHDMQQLDALEYFLGGVKLR